MYSVRSYLHQASSIDGHKKFIRSVSHGRLVSNLFMFYTHEELIFADLFVFSNKFILAVAPYLPPMSTVFIFTVLIIVVQTNLSEDVLGEKGPLKECVPSFSKQYTVITSYVTDKSFV